MAAANPLPAVLCRGGACLRPRSTPAAGGGKLRPYGALGIAVCLFLLGAVNLAAQTQPAHELAIYSADLDHSAVGFSVRHFVTPVPGRFRDFSATLRYDRDDPSRSSVEFRVKAA